MEVAEDTVVGGLLVRDWDEEPVTTLTGLVLALKRATRRYGQPVRWAASEVGILIFATEEEVPGTFPFMSPPDAMDLGRQIWPWILTAYRAAGTHVLPLAHVLIPKRPGIANFNTWDLMQQVQCAEGMVCFVRFTTRRDFQDV